MAEVGQGRAGGAARGEAARACSCGAAPAPSRHPPASAPAVMQSQGAAMTKAWAGSAARCCVPDHSRAEASGGKAGMGRGRWNAPHGGCGARGSTVPSFVERHVVRPACVRVGRRSCVGAQSRVLWPPSPIAFRGGMGCRPRLSEVRWVADHCSKCASRERCAYPLRKQERRVVHVACSESFRHGPVYAQARSCVRGL